MKKRETIHSLQDIASLRIPDAQSICSARADAPRQREKKETPVAAAEIEDESALFLEAVAATIDVSLKNTIMPVMEPPSEETPPPAFGVAVPSLKRKNTPPPDAMKKKETDSAMQHKAAPLSREEENLFINAMDGVAPIRAGGRDLAPPVKLPKHAEIAEAMLIEELFSAKLEFSLEYTEEYVHGHVLGTDPVILGKMRAGAYSPEGHLDLHGLNLEQAYASLNMFIKNAYQVGKRHVLVITGRGKNSPGGTPVLRERVQAWFTRDPFKRVVLAFCTAKPGDGGAGALYLLLRRRKKNQGKIIWDRVPSEEELLL